MASAVKYQVFVGNLAGKVHDILGTDPGTDCDVLKVMLSNTAPNASTHTIRSEAGEITGGNGYTTGGEVIAGQSGTRTGGTFTLAGNEIEWVGGATPMATFRYAILYNDTPTDPTDPLILSWDHGEAIELDEGQSFFFRPSNEETGGTILTIA